MRQTNRPDYYPISYLMRDHYGVLFPIGPIRLKNGETLQMRDVPGFRKTYRKGLPTQRIMYRVMRSDGRSEDLPEPLAANALSAGKSSAVSGPATAARKPNKRGELEEPAPSQGDRRAS